MQRVSAPRKHSHHAKTRGRSADWYRWPLIGLLAVVAGVFSYNFVPTSGSIPVADRLTHGIFAAPALPSLLGQGMLGTTYDPLPAPVSIATAKAPAARHKPSPKHSPGTTPPRSGPLFVDAAGLGLYDGQSSPSGIETAASWLGSSSSIKYAQDFIDATDFSHISNP